MAIIKQYHPASHTTYVYESTSKWVPELRQSRCKRKLIGKLGPNGEIIPTGKPGRPKKNRDNASETSGDRGDEVQDELFEQKAEVAKLRARVEHLEVENRRLVKALARARSLAAQIQDIQD